MKWTVLVGLFGVGVGFLVGSMRDGEDASGPSVVAQSVRRLEVRGQRELREGGGTGESRWKVAEDLSRKIVVGKSLGEVEKGRLAKWILELELEDFPDVLETLKGIGQEVPAGPFPTQGENSEFLTLGMARWYELAGESVLEWVLTEPVVLEGGNQRVLVGDLIRDGYEREPTLSFQILKKYAGVVAKLDGRKGIGVSWRYQVGKWSVNLKSELAELEALEGIYGVALDETAHYGDGVAHPETALLRGLVEGERTEVARGFYDDEGFERYERALARVGEDDIARRGWRDLKSAIDGGEVVGSSRRVNEVFEGWVEVDSEAAISWFLGQRFEEMSRSEQIEEVMFSEAFRTEGGADVWRNPLDVDRVLGFLDQKQAEGELVDESYSVLALSLADTFNWDEMEKLKSRVSAEVWESGLNRVSAAATDVTRFRLGGAEEELMFVDFEDGGRELLSRFGIEEDVVEHVARTNEESLGRLMEELGVEGE